MKNTPQHIAIIMDGNRRWAKKNKLPILMGHRHAAFETIEKITDAAIKLKVKYITLWAFSTENWNRNKNEVAGLLNLFREILGDNINKLHNKGVKILSIGDLSKFPEDIQNQMRLVEEKTKNNKNLTVVLALNYGGRDEIIRAIKKLSPQELKTITEDSFSKSLDTKNIPDPELLIRTGGEIRLSGFLPWQTEYTEFYFTEKLWPDFTEKDLTEAITEYQNRQRRFGK